MQAGLPSNTALGPPRLLGAAGPGRAAAAHMPPDPALSSLVPAEREAGPRAIGRRQEVPHSQGLTQKGLCMPLASPCCSPRCDTAATPPRLVTPPLPVSSLLRWNWKLRGERHSLAPCAPRAVTAITVEGACARQLPALNGGLRSPGGRHGGAEALHWHSGARAQGCRAAGAAASGSATWPASREGSDSRHEEAQRWAGLATSSLSSQATRYTSVGCKVGGAGFAFGRPGAGQQCQAAGTAAGSTAGLASAEEGDSRQV